MKRQWENEDLIEHWMLSVWELAQLGNKTGATRLGFALLLKFFVICQDSCPVCQLICHAAKRLEQIVSATYNGS
jgi:hypothetical protein